MTRDPRVSVLDRLMVAGLRPDLVHQFRDIRRRRRPCYCSLCIKVQESEPSDDLGPRQLGWESDR
jgi:hypothetical protein